MNEAGPVDNEIAYPTGLVVSPTGPNYVWQSFGPPEKCPSHFEEARRQAVALGLPRWLRSSAQMPSTEGPLLSLAGLVFHVNRCGSTLISNVLARLSAVQVANDPEALLDVYRPANQLRDPSWRVSHLATGLSALARPISAEKRHLIVKMPTLSSKFMLEFGQVTGHAPRVLIYRDPLEVLMSNIHEPPRWSGHRRDPISAAIWSGVEPSRAATFDLVEFLAHCEARYFAAAATAVLADPAAWVLVDYDELPEAIFERILPAFGLRGLPEELALMREECRYASKSFARRKVFLPDTGAKRAAAGDRERSLARALIEPHYRRLQSLAQGEKSIARAPR